MAHALLFTKLYILPLLQSRVGPSLAATGQHRDLQDSFTLLGDPALRIDLTIVPWASWAYMPVTMRK